MEVIALIVIWFLLAPVAAMIAEKKGLSGWGFYFLSILLSPFIGIIVALVATPNIEKMNEKLLKDGKVKMCPACAELVKPDAMVCKHCGKDLEATPS